jgi:hypothetical protein
MEPLPEPSASRSSSIWTDVDSDKENGPSAAARPTTVPPPQSASPSLPPQPPHARRHPSGTSTNDDHKRTRLDSTECADSMRAGVGEADEKTCDIPADVAAASSNAAAPAGLATPSLGAQPAASVSGATAAGAPQPTTQASAATAAASTAAALVVLASPDELWVDAQDASGVWWPARLVAGPRDDMVQVRVPRIGGSNTMWVDFKCGVVPAGQFAYYGRVDSVLRVNQAVLLSLPSVAAVSSASAAAASAPAGTGVGAAAGVDASADGAGAVAGALSLAAGGIGSTNWVEAVVTDVSSMGMASLSVLGASGEQLHTVHSASKRLRPTGPNRLHRLHKASLQDTLVRLQQLQQQQSAMLPPRLPLSDGGVGRAPLSASSANVRGAGEGKVGRQGLGGVQGAGVGAGAGAVVLRPGASPGSSSSDAAGLSPGSAQQQARPRIISAASAQHAHFLHSLQARGMRVFVCLGDGNCLFRSVAHQVYGDQELHNLVRDVAFRHMRAHEDDFSPFCAALMEEHVAAQLREVGDPRPVGELYTDAQLFRMYVDMYSRDHVWGGDPELSAICRVYRRTAHLYVYDRKCVRFACDRVVERCVCVRACMRVDVPPYVAPRVCRCDVWWAS